MSTQDDRVAISFSQKFNIGMMLEAMSGLAFDESTWDLGPSKQLMLVALSSLCKSGTRNCLANDKRIAERLRLLALIAACVNSALQRRLPEFGKVFREFLEAPGATSTDAKAAPNDADFTSTHAAFASTDVAFTSTDVENLLN